MGYTVACFDLDDCLIHEGFATAIICEDTKTILDYLKNLKSVDVKIALASHNEEALPILQELGISTYFDIVLGYYDESNKVSHLHKIAKALNVGASQIVFYDDVQVNIAATREHGFKGFLVNYVTGVKLEEVISRFK